MFVRAIHFFFDSRGTFPPFFLAQVFSSSACPHGKEDDFFFPFPFCSWGVDADWPFPYLAVPGTGRQDAFTVDESADFLLVLGAASVRVPEEGCVGLPPAGEHDALPAFVLEAGRAVDALLVLTVQIPADLVTKVVTHDVRGILCHFGFRGQGDHGRDQEDDKKPKSHSLLFLSPAFSHESDSHQM